MISIFIMYSNDRAHALDYTLACLRSMDYYDKCQRTLVVDGKIESVPTDWDHVQVPRVAGDFCWGRMWDAGVCTARYPLVIYLDADRLLPKNYLRLVANNLKNDVFLFTSNHFMMLKELPIELCRKFLHSADSLSLLIDDAFMGCVRYEPRFVEPVHGPSKNVMSGSTAFTKKTYLHLGGVDHWYRGHGAFADTDFHLQAALGGCKFVDLMINELHFPHQKLGDDNNPLDNSALYRMGLDNFIYYCWKWKLPVSLAEELAVRCGIKRPNKYVDKQIGFIKEAAKVF